MNARETGIIELLRQDIQELRNDHKALQKAVSLFQVTTARNSVGRAEYQSGIDSLWKHVEDLGRTIQAHDRRLVVVFTVGAVIVGAIEVAARLL